MYPPGGERFLFAFLGCGFRSGGMGFADSVVCLFAFRIFRRHDHEHVWVGRQEGR